MDAISTEETTKERTTHTPGPWHVESGTVICAGEMRLTRTLEALTEMGDRDKFYETRANARLIAAAPELLEALTLLHDNLAEYQRINNLGGYDNHDMKMARDAIAKAKG